MKQKLIALVVGLVVGASGMLMMSSGGGIGVALPVTPALFETSLAAPITSTASSLTLTSNSVRGGGTLAGYACFTIDEGSAQAEFVCGTASSTSVTSVTRGISPSDGVTSVASLKFSHRRGASVKVTNFPIIQLLRAQNNGEGTFENVLSYASGVVPASADQLADVGYVLSVVTGGAVSFDQLVVAGTAGETMATGTLTYFDTADQEWKKVDSDTQSTFARVPLGLTQGPGVDGGTIGTGVLLMGRDTTQTGLTPGSDYYATSTAGAIHTDQTGLLVGRADDATTLYFNPELDITLLDNTFTGQNTFSATTTFSETTITGHASTSVQVFTVDGTYTKKPGLEYISLRVQAAGGDGDATGGGGSGGYSEGIIYASELSSTETVTVGVAGVGSGNTSFGSLITAGNGGDASTDTGGTAGSASGGYLNISGQAGQAGFDSNGGGKGGDSFMGSSGGFTPSVSSIAINAAHASQGFGAGGSGCSNANDNNPACVTGDAANGTAGIVIVTEHY